MKTHLLFVGSEASGKLAVSCKSAPEVSCGKPTLANHLCSEDSLHVDELLHVHEYERQRLGQELHDCTGQLVVSLLLGLGRLRSIERDRTLETLIDEIEQTARQIDKEIRSLAFLHHSAELANHSLPDSLQILASGFGRRTGINTVFKCDGLMPPIDEPTATALLRIAQEALVNVHRHSRATSAVVQLRKLSRGLRLRVSDNGIGLGSSVARTGSCGVGLAGMRHRVECLKGQFEIRCRKPGLTISATIPMAA